MLFLTCPQNGWFDLFPSLLRFDLAGPFCMYIPYKSDESNFFALVWRYFVLVDKIDHVCVFYSVSYPLCLLSKLFTVDKFHYFANSRWWSSLQYSKSLPVSISNTGLAIWYHWAATLDTMLLLVFCLWHVLTLSTIVLEWGCGSGFNVKIIVGS